jgi:hypothetical protein
LWVGVEEVRVVQLVVWVVPTRSQTQSSSRLKFVAWISASMLLDLVDRR